MTKEWINHSDRPIDVIAMGRVAVDLYAEQIGLPLKEVQSFKKYLGGCAGNIAVGCARLGLHSAMLSCVGDDAMGEFLIATLQTEKVDITQVQKRSQHLTGLVILGIQPPDRFPLLFYRENCADMQLMPAHIQENFLRQANILLLTGTGLSTSSMFNTTHHAIQLAKKTKTRIVLDLDYRPVLWQITQRGDGETRYLPSQKVSEQYQTVLFFCDLIVGTEEEMCIAGGVNQLPEALQQIRHLTDAILVVKKGEKGCHIYVNDLNEPIVCAPFPVSILNVLGAGDAFISGFLRGLLRGESLETCGQYANAAGAIVVTRHGCAPAMPYFSELLDFISSYHASETQHVLSHSSPTWI